MKQRLTTVLIGGLLIVGFTVGAARSAIGPGSDDTLLRTRNGLVVSGYVDACKVVRIEPGMLVVGDGTLAVPVVYASLVTRERVALADEEGQVDQVAQSVRNAQPACHRVTLSDAQLLQLAELIAP